VTVTAPVLQSITITPASPSLAKGLTQQLTATGNYQNGSTQNLTASVTWSSSIGSVATVSVSGLATSVATGATVISATMGTITGKTLLTVTPATLSSIVVTPVNPAIAKGTTEQFVATGTYSDGTMQTITSTAVWTSATPTVATISNSPGTEGLATSVAQGTSIITATLSGKSGATTLTVNPAALVSIAITPATPSVIAAGTVQLTATGTYTDLSTQNITTAVTWLSNNTSVATIGAATGLATGVAAGTSGITATDPVTSIVSPMVTLTVRPAEHAYVTNYHDNTVSQYTISPTGGALVAKTSPTIATGTNPFAIAVDTTHSFVYVGNSGGTTVNQYTIGSDGSLAANTVAATVGTGSGPNDIFVTAGNAYVANFNDGTVYQYAVNGNGTLTALTPAFITVGGAAGTSAVAVTTNTGGTYAVVANYSADTVVVYTVGAGGALTTPAVSSLTLPQGTLPNVPHPVSVAIDATGSFVYVGDEFNNVVWQLGLSASGTLTTLSAPTVTVGGNPFFVDLTSTIGGTSLYVANTANGTVQQLTPGAGGLLTLDTATTNVGTGTNPSSVSIDPSGQFSYVTQRGIASGNCTLPCSTSVSQYTIGVTGAFTPMTAPTATSGNEPSVVVTTSH